MKIPVTLALTTAMLSINVGVADDQPTVRARLQGFKEVPAVSSPARGSFTAALDRDASIISYELTYSGLQGTAQQSHIHFGQTHVNGGISVFLCSNLGNGPAGTQACPPEGTIKGAIRASDVIGPGGQGIGAGEFAELLTAINAGVAYVNVHTTTFPAGEIRGQLKGNDDKD